MLRKTSRVESAAPLGEWERGDARLAEEADSSTLLASLLQEQEENWARI